MTLSYEFYRPTSNDQGDTNGGYPIPTIAPSSGTLPVSFSAMNDVEKIWYNKLTAVYTGLPLYARPMIFEQPPVASGKHYFTLVFEPTPNNVETQLDMLTDLGSRRQYGVLEITNAVAIGATAIDVTAKNLSLLNGAAKIIYADGTTLTDNVHLDERVTATTGDTNPQEEVVVTNISNIVDMGDGTGTATLTLQAGTVNAYAAGAKLQTYPDKEDYTATADSLDDTNIGAGNTFAIANVTTNGQYTWEDEITLTVNDAAGNYTLASDHPDLSIPGSGSLGADFQATYTGDSYFTSHSFTIPANTLQGTFTGGESLTFETHVQGASLWIIYRKPADPAGIVRDALKLSISAEEESV